MALDMSADLLTAVKGDFAESITYTPNGGAAVSFSAIFDQQYAEIEGVDSAAPAVHCLSSDVSNAKQGDTVVVQSVTYSVISVQPDGTGVVVLILSRQ